MRLQIKNIALGICALLALSTATNAAQVTAPQGNDRALTVTDFMPHTPISKEFNETWSYQIVFDNGTRAFLNYSILYIPGSGRKIGCDLSFWNFKGKTYAVGRQYPPERLVANKEKATIDIKGEYKLENKPGKGHRVFYSADKGGKFLLDVTFESAVPGMVPGNGIWTYGKEKFAQFIHIPYGRVSGKIAYNEDTLTVKGYAYMDQTWQTAQATDMAARTINFSTNEKSPMHAGRITLTTDGQLMGYALYNGPQGMKVAIPTKVKEGGSDYNGKKFATTTMSFEWKNGVPALVFPVNKVLQKASLLDKVDGWFAKKAAKIAAGGEVLFYRGRSQNGLGKKIDWAITGVKD
ncbi:MAG: hypothetical protein II565_01770 [Fibrobacter sp.]|nr:hypothetical protein [Fibrobacter sp.]MBQ5464534.1 hypothetical protein [Fibrobacter sp.]